jgi:pterin-4a-carbinolamine dehydratase
MKLSHLHEEFMAAARAPMIFGRLPVMPRESDVPLIAVNQWQTINKTLVKSFQFRLKDQRNNFIKEILDHEEKVCHNAKIKICDDTVEIMLQTQDINQITEFDKEYAAYADELFKEVVYSHDT